MRIEIAEVNVDEFSGVSKRTGRAFTIRTQKAYVKLENEKYPTPFKLQLKDQQEPYQPGVYTLHPTLSYYIDRHSGLSLSPVLVPSK